MRQHRIMRVRRDEERGLAGLDQIDHGLHCLRSGQRGEREPPDPHSIIHMNPSKDRVDRGSSSPAGRCRSSSDRAGATRVKWSGRSAGISSSATTSHDSRPVPIPTRTSATGIINQPAASWAKCPPDRGAEQVIAPRRRRDPEDVADQGDGDDARQEHDAFPRGHRDEDGHRGDRRGQAHEHRQSVAGGGHLERVGADEDHVPLGHDPEARELQEGATAHGRQPLQRLRQDAVDALGQGEQEDQERDRRPDPAEQRPAADRQRQAGDHRQERGRLRPFGAALVADAHARPAPPTSPTQPHGDGSSARGSASTQRRQRMTSATGTTRKPCE